MEKVRIQKVLSDSGVASRRNVEEMIVEGRVTVNGELVNELPCFVDPEADEIRVDGALVRKRPHNRVCFLLNKPRGVVCTQRDPKGRPLATQLVPDISGRVYCIGGLDDEASGLVLLTNDGELTKHLTDPRTGVEMDYVVEVDGQPDEDDFVAIRNGVFIEGLRTKKMKVRVLNRGQRTALELRTTEGRNQMLRRVFQRLGHKLRRLKRTALGPLREHGLKTGNFRMLMPREIEQLRRLQPATPAPAADQPAEHLPDRAPAGAPRRPALRRPPAKRPAPTRPAAMRPAAKRPAGKPPSRRPPGGASKRPKRGGKR